MPATDPIFAGLTPDQHRAAAHTQGPLLILAAAGSGKTRVITRRIAHLLALGEPAWSILALTFTNKAAGEMRERVDHLLASTPGLTTVRTRGLTITTFHALCARLLRRYAPFMQARPDWAITADFTIYDADDQRALMKQTIKAMGLDTSNWSPRNVLAAVSDAKNTLRDARSFEHDAADFYSRTIAQIYARYQRALDAANAVDFDDLLLLTVRLLRENDEVRTEVNNRYRHLMIDEYQDTNHAQFVLASLLIGEGETPGLGPNIAVVGDPDQSIYGWRGADIANILEFEERYPEATTIALGQNFRSTAPILACADTLIRNNLQRKHKPLYTDREGGEPPTVLLVRDEQHEAAEVAKFVRGMVEGGIWAWDTGDDTPECAPTPEPSDLAWKDVAVMYRNNALSRVLEDALRRDGIPYVIARGTAFYQREEIKDALAYLRVVANPADEVSLLRVVNKPARKIGKSTVAALQTFAARERITVFEAMRRADEAEGLTNIAIKSCAQFTELIDGWTAGGTFLGSSIPTDLNHLVERVINESNLEAHYRKQAAKLGPDEGESKLDNLAELVSSATQFDDDYDAAQDPAFDPFDFLGELSESEAAAADGADAARTDPEGGADVSDEFTPPLLARLRAYLESVSLIADADRVDPARGAVTLMTLHAAKGLEFPAVIVVGLEEGTLPGQRAMESEGDLEEERRLLFVGITRAMSHLLITSAKYRTLRGRSERCIPSRFLDELPEEHARLVDRSGIAQGLGSAWGEEGGAHPRGGAQTPRTSRDAFGRTLEAFDDVAPFDEGSPATGADTEAFDQRPPEERGIERRPRRGAGGTARKPRLGEGDRVRHPQFGEGTVLSVSPGLNSSARIAFEETGTKTLILQYARLEVLA